MSNQLAIKERKSVNDDESGQAECSIGSVAQNSFHWNKETEMSLLFNMIRLKPCGINKHLNVLLLSEKMSADLKCHVPTDAIWKYLDKKWNISAADKIESTCFDVSKEDDFTLPEEYNQLISDQIKKMNIKTLKKDGIGNEINKGKELVVKTKNKSNSMSSVDSKDSLNEIRSSLSSERSSAKINEIGSEELPARTRRSLRAYDKHEDKDLEDDSSNKKKILRVNNKSDELNKSKDYKMLSKKSSNQFKEQEKNDRVSNINSRKRKSRNVSESSISSDNSKPLTSFKNNLADLTLSGSSSRSVTPELLKGFTAKRSITPESISRKSNLRSGDKDQKSKLALEKACVKLGHHVDIILPEIKIERLKTNGKLIAAYMESKSKHLAQNKSDANNKVKGKTRGRVTSDFLVVQQSPDVPLGRRSCSSKSSS